MTVQAKSIIFLSPHVPAKSGHGASMRVGAHLEILSHHYRVHLHLLIQDGASALDREFLGAHATSINIWKIPGTRQPTSLIEGLVDTLNPAPRLIREYPLELAKKIADSLPKNTQITKVHVFRLCLAAVGERLTQHLGIPSQQLMVDMDDYESESASRSLILQKATLGRALSTFSFIDIFKLKRFERRLAKKCGGLFLCSEIDQQKFIRKNPVARIRIVPNGYRLPEQILPRNNAGKNKILFVGSLNYQPNTDAIEYFVTAIWLPYLQGAGLELVIAGRQPPESIRKLCTKHHLTLLADPPEIEPVYRDAALLVVPLRTGGGTRIKILEAFGYGRPVVSTRVGAEGIEVDDGVHLLLADDPLSFSNACLRVLTEPTLATELISAGRRLAESNYSLAAIESAIDAGYQGFNT